MLGKKSDHKTALKVAAELLRPGSQFILIETRPYLVAALEKFEDQSPAVSLTDCIVMTVADDYGTKRTYLALTSSLRTPDIPGLSPQLNGSKRYNDSNDGFLRQDSNFERQSEHES